MAKAELKRLLKYAQSEPVRVAFALGADGKAIVVMDRRKQPMALAKELREAAPDSKNQRWGTASVGADDPKLVRFSVNKAANGMGRKLVVALKGTGFSKVEVGSEDGEAPEKVESDEPEEGEKEGGLAPHGAAGQSGTAAGKADAGAGIGKTVGAAAGPLLGPEVGSVVGAALGDALVQKLAPKPAGISDPVGQLTERLTPKVRQMLELVANDPAQKAALAKLAQDAQASLKGTMLTRTPENVQKTAAIIDQFSKAVDEAATHAGGAAQGKAVAGAADEQAGKSVQGAKQSDAQRVADRLTQLAKQAVSLAQADPAHGAEIKQYLTQARATLHKGDLRNALANTRALHDLLGQAQAAQGRPSAELFTELAARWHQAEQQAQVDLQKYKAALDALYEGDPAAPDMEAAFKSHADLVFGRFDGKLADALRRAGAANSEAELAPLKAELRRAVEALATFLTHDTLVEIDRNPFVKIDIVGRCEAALAAMQSALQ